MVIRIPRLPMSFCLAKTDDVSSAGFLLEKGMNGFVIAGPFRQSGSANLDHGRS